MGRRSRSMIGEDAEREIIELWDEWKGDPNNLSDWETCATNAMFTFFSEALPREIKDEILYRNNCRHNDDFAWQRVKYFLLGYEDTVDPGSRIEDIVVMRDRERS